MAKERAFPIQESTYTETSHTALAPSLSPPGDDREAHVLSMEYAAHPAGAPVYYHGTAPDALGFILHDGLRASSPADVCSSSGDDAGSTHGVNTIPGMLRCDILSA